MIHPITLGESRAGFPGSEATASNRDDDVRGATADVQRSFLDCGYELWCVSYIRLSGLLAISCADSGAGDLRASSPFSAPLPPRVFRGLR